MSVATTATPPPVVELESAYHFIASLGAFYIHALQDGHLPPGADRYVGLIDSILCDIGKAHELWHLFLDQVRAGYKPPRLRHWQQQEARLMPRIKRLQGRVNAWTPMSRWLLVLHAAETVWQSLLGELKQEGLDRDQIVVSLLQESKKRSDSLRTLSHEWRQYQAKLTENYASPAAI